MPLENVFHSDQHRRAERIRYRSIKLSCFVVLLLSQFWMPLLGVILISGGFGLHLARSQHTISKLKARPNTMAQHDINGKIEAFDIARYTVLGMAYDFREWKQERQTIERNTGHVAREALRDLEHQLYPKMRPLCISDSALCQHATVVMPSGGGKSELYKIIQRQLVSRGAGMIGVDLKGTLDYVGAVYRFCEENNRLDDLRVIALDNTEYSHRYSPLASGSARGLIAQLSQLQGKSAQEFFDNVSRFGTTAAVLTLSLQPGAPKFRICDVAALLADLDELLMYVKRIDENESEEHKSGLAFLVAYLRYWQIDEEWNYKEYKDRMLGNMTTLLGYCFGSYDKIVNTYDPDVILRDVLTKGRIVIFTASTNTDEKGVNLMGKMLMNNLSQTIGELEAEGFKAALPCPLMIDEYRGMRDASQTGMWQLFRSVRMPIFVNVQNVSMLADPNDSAFQTSVLGNSDTLIVGRAKDSETRQLIADAAGSFLNKLRQESVGRNEGSGSSSDTSGIITQNNSGLSHSNGYRENEEDLVSTDDLRELEDGQFLTITREGVYRVIGQMTETKPVKDWGDMRLARFSHAANDEHGIYEQFIKRQKSFIFK